MIGVKESKTISKPHQLLSGKAVMNPGSRDRLSEKRQSSDKGKVSESDRKMAKRDNGGSSH
jgi:hypothetical protein